MIFNAKNAINGTKEIFKILKLYIAHTAIFQIKNYCR
jgi:hypothetical protein